MTKHLQNLVCLIAFGAVGCTPIVPKELADARMAYDKAAQGPASNIVPAELHKAHVALDRAEASFKSDPNSQTTRDLAYVADRRARTAEALGMVEVENQRKAQAMAAYETQQARMAQMTTQALGKTREQLAETERRVQQEMAQLQQEKQGRMSAEEARAAAEAKVATYEAKTKELQDSLAKLAAVKEEQRGLVITLSGSVLFPSGQSTLLPDARTRLDQVADALMSTKERDVVIQGFTDSRGSEERNQELSQRRAQAVRDYLVTRGYPEEKIRAEGLGKDRPIADNASAEGRANNRRVEIVVKPMKKEGE